jgi:hypothetical protein
MNVTAKLFAQVFGAVYLLIGLVGFALTGFEGFAAPDGHVLILFEVNPLHNIVHVLIGASLLAAASAGEMASRRVAGLIAAVYAVVGLVGFALVGNSSLNILALNHPDNFLHLATAAVGAVVLMRQRAAVPA